MPRQPRLEAPGVLRPRMVRGKEEDNLQIRVGLRPSG